MNDCQESLDAHSDKLLPFQVFSPSIIFVQNVESKKVFCLGDSVSKCEGKHVLFAIAISDNCHFKNCA